MSKTSRLAIASSFVLSSVALAVALRGAPSQEATAGPIFASDLGPADALLLNTETGKDPLRVAAKDGRISWGDRATNRVWSVASVDIDTVMKNLLDRPSYLDARKELDEKTRGEEGEFQKRLEAIKAKYPTAENAPPPAEAQQEVMALQREYQGWMETVRRSGDKLGAEQFEQAYRELVSAVETVADKESIDLVFRFYPTAEPFKSERTGEALSQIQSRTFLKYPASIDITPEVMKALNLSE
jgi:Skp family chaperone for outer membrane proteins